MRQVFDQRLDSVRGALVVMSATAASAIRWASDALLAADLAPAEPVLRADDEVKSLRRRVDQEIYALLAQEQPVASDLRLAVAGLHVAGDIERMSALAVHVAKAMLRRHPERTVPPEAEEIFRRMGEVAERLAWKMTRVLELRDATLAAELDRDDDEMDALHRSLLSLLFGDWRHGVVGAVDLALLGRYYERYTDHVVNCGRHVTFLVTG